MAFKIVAHGRRGPISWAPFASREEANRKLFQLWAEEAMPEIGTAWELVAEDAPPSSFTLWRQDYDAHRQWRDDWRGLAYDDAIAEAVERSQTLPPAPHSPQRVLVLPDGAPAPPREPSYAVEVKARALGHAGWEKAVTGVTAKGAADVVRQLQRRKQPPGWEDAEVRVRFLEPFAILPGHRYRVVRPDHSALMGLGAHRGRWQYGEIGVAAPNESDKYDARLLLVRAPRPPLRAGASGVERMDYLFAGSGEFYFYRDDIEPVDSVACVEAAAPRRWKVLVGQALDVIEDPPTGLVAVGKATGDVPVWMAFVPSGARAPVPASWAGKSFADVAACLVWTGRFLPSGALEETSAAFRGKKLAQLIECIKAGDPLKGRRSTAMAVLEAAWARAGATEADKQRAREKLAAVTGAAEKAAAIISQYHAPLRAPGVSMTTAAMVAHDAAVMERRGKPRKRRPR